MFVVNRDVDRDVDNHRATDHDLRVKVGKRTSQGNAPEVDDGAPERWNTLAKRLRWVVQNRRDAVSSLEDWAVKAGRARQYLSSAIKRAEEGGGSLGLREAASLVRVPGINLDLFWLATGLGTPAGGTRDVEDLFPLRAKAAARAREVGVLDDEIERVRRRTNADPNKYRDDTEAQWYQRFLEEAARRPRLVPAPDSEI